MSAKGFMPGLFDRLIDRPGQAQTGTVPRVSLEEMKDSVARDLEALLNTRAVMPEEAFRRFPECARSIVAYGLHDFAGLSLSSTDDRAFICRSLEAAIARPKRDRNPPRSAILPGDIDAAHHGGKRGQPLLAVYHKTGCPKALPLGTDGTRLFSGGRVPQDQRSHRKAEEE